MEGNSLVSFENLCKIFEMRIRLDRETGVKTSLEVLDNYEKYSKKIDNAYNGQFQKELKPLISPAVTLEKEKDRLRRLIKLLEDRLDKRIELEDRYYETTGKYLSGLQMIVSDAELEEKRERLALISKYLETKEEITSVKDSLLKLRDSLNEEENKKFEYEEKNKIMEDELYASFVSVIKNNEYFKNINEDDIDNELEDIRVSVLETKETLDITKESVGSLSTSGLDDEYASYVEEAEKNYYGYKNKEIILKIYKLITMFEDDFKQLYSKREKIIDLLKEKRELGSMLTLQVKDELLPFEKVLSSQCNTLDNEKDVIDNIANYTSRIKFKEERLAELNEVNDSVDILAILREYGLIETYDTEDVVLVEEEIDYPLVEEIEENSLESFIPKFEIPSLEEIDIKEDTVIEEFYDPYRIVEILDYPKTLNVGLAKLKGESVREKVNKKLNPKKKETTFEDIVEVEATGDNDNVTGTSESTLVEIEMPSVKENDKVEEVKEDVIATENVTAEPLWTPTENVTPVMVTPVWELPEELDVKPAVVKEEDKPNTLPVWDIKPEMPNPQDSTQTSNLDNFNIMDKPIDNVSNFWMPVSDSKVDNNVFPTIGLTNNNVNNSSEFVFPTMNN